jgi:APA family basic amino acid/polyamine antiporter
VPDLNAEAIMIISIIFTLITFVLTWRRVDISAGVQFFLFAFTLMAGLLYLVLFVFSPDFQPGVNWNPFFAFETQGFLSGVGLMVTMYFGFELIPQFAEECDYPHKKHWKVMMFSVVVAMVIYASISLVETAVRPLSVILEMPNFVGAIEAKEIYGQWLAYPVIFASIATLMSCVIGFWLGASRVMYSMGREGVMPHVFTRTNKHHQPLMANIAILGITVFLTFYCYAAGTDWVVALYTMMAIGVAIAYTFTCIAYVRLKYTKPNHPRLWKAPGGKVMGAVAAVAGAFITYEVFATFNGPTWLVFGLFFVIVIFLRLYLAYDQKAHKEKYYDMDDKKEEEQMAEIAKKEA